VAGTATILRQPWKKLPPTASEHLFFINELSSQYSIHRITNQSILLSNGRTSIFKMRFSTPLSTSISSAPVTRKEPKQTFSLAHNGPNATGPVKATPTKPLSQAEKDTKAVRIVNPNFRKLNVEATDNYVAPVAKLSQWLASDPTKPKKEYLTIRKGNNIIAKSSKYENQDMAIGKKAQQLQEIAEKTIVTDNRKQYESPIKNETASTKDSIKSPVEPVVVDETSPVVEDVMPVVELVELDDDFPLEIETTKEVVAVEEPSEEGKKLDQDDMSELTVANESADAAITTAEVSTTEVVDNEGVEANKSFEEAKKTFGPGFAPPTTVQLRKQKLEQMEAEARRRANNPYGLLKPSWKRPHPSKGKPSDAWSRTFQGQLPPKKTLAELP
jgi:hypothetical protein